jgi:hypothetical protein
MLWVKVWYPTHFDIVVLKSNVSDPRLSLGDPTTVSELMVWRRVQLAPCIESLPNKGGQTMCSVECDQRNGESTKNWMTHTWG